MKPRQPDFDIAADWLLEAKPEELTEVVLDPALIHLWCPSVFMASRVIDRGRPDGLGMTIKVYSKGWLPHIFICTSRVVDLVPHRYMRIAVEGDFEGVGELTLRPLDDRYCTLRLHWRTDVRHPHVRHLKRILRPIFVWNHNWAMARANRLMQREIDRRRAASADFPSVRATFPHNLPAVRMWLLRRAARRDTIPSGIPDLR